MSKRRVALFPSMLVALLLGAFMLPAVAGAERSLYVFNTKLTGEAERTNVGGDPDGKGKAQIKIDLETGTICYSLRVKDIGPLTGAHIHEITMNGTGPVAQGLELPTGGRSSGCVTNAALAWEIVADPSDYYVNVHTTEYPAGAIRGDLR